MNTAWQMVLWTIHPFNWESHQCCQLSNSFLSTSVTTSIRTVPVIWGGHWSIYSQPLRRSTTQSLAPHYSMSIRRHIRVRWQGKAYRSLPTPLSFKQGLRNCGKDINDLLVKTIRFMLTRYSVSSGLRLCSVRTLFSFLEPPRQGSSSRTSGTVLWCHCPAWFVGCRKVFRDKNADLFRLLY